MGVIAVIELGTLTVCGHQYCAECLGVWYKQHRCCPMCKRHLKTADMYPITYETYSQVKFLGLSELTYNHRYNPQKIEFHEEQYTPTTHKGSNAVHAIYTDIKESMLAQIKSMRIENSFGSKIDMSEFITILLMFPLKNYLQLNHIKRLIAM